MVNKDNMVNKDPIGDSSDQLTTICLGELVMLLLIALYWCTRLSRGFYRTKNKLIKALETTFIHMEVGALLFVFALFSFLLNLNL